MKDGFLNCRHNLRGNLFLKYLAIKICICYNADRQKDVSNPFKQGTNPSTVREYSWGILLFFYSGKAPTRLFVVLMVAV